MYISQRKYSGACFFYSDDPYSGPWTGTWEGYHGDVSHLCNQYVAAHGRSGSDVEIIIEIADQ